MNTMSQRQKSVITYIMLVGCICVHIGESSVTKGVLPLFSDTFDKVRIRDWQPKQLFLYPGFAFGNLSGSLVLWNMWHAAAQFPFVSLFSAETTGPIFAKILRYSGISGALKSCIYKALYHFIYESQNDGSAEFAIFFHKIGCHGNVPWDIRKRGPDRSSAPKSFHLVKDCENRSSGSWEKR